MKLSVIVPFFNSASTIACQLEALAGQCYSEPWEVIAVDNNSTDLSKAIVERYRNHLANLRIVDAFAQQSQAYARNVGAQAASGESLVFCDADDEVGVGWLAAMGEALSNYDFVACRLDFQKLNPCWQRENFARPQKVTSKKPIIPLSSFMQAAVASVSNDRFMKRLVGLMNLCWFSEDTDYCFRAQLAGVTLHFVPGAVVHVRDRETLSASFRQARLWAQYQVLLYKRYRQLTGMKWSAVGNLFSTLERIILATPPTSQRRQGGQTWIRSLGWQIGRLEGSLRHWIGPV